MALRPCLVCGLPTPTSRCPRHGRASATSRGYGTDHRKARAHLLATLPAPCGDGCGTTLTADTMVTAHRIDGDATAGWIPSCRSCNERAMTGHAPRPYG